MSSKKSEKLGEEKIIVLDNPDFDDFVNSDKAKRSVDAANGISKPQTSETVLAARFKAEGLEGTKLVRAIYVGLAGLIDRSRAVVNRKNQRKAAAAKLNR